MNERCLRPREPLQESLVRLILGLSFAVAGWRLWLQLVVVSGSGVDFVPKPTEVGHRGKQLCNSVDCLGGTMDLLSKRSRLLICYGARRETYYKEHAIVTNHQGSDQGQR